MEINVKNILTWIFIIIVAGALTFVTQKHNDRVRKDAILEKKYKQAVIEIANKLTQEHE